MSEAKVYSAKMDKISDRVMKGETPLQAVARQGITPATEARSIERFPYYTAFPYAWYRACYADEIEVGQVKPLRLLNRELVIWRGEDGEAHVMEAYCAHLGAHLGFGGRVEGCEIICPFHWWQYDGDGNNTLIPYEGGRNKTAKIRSFPTIDRNGLIMFWYHPQNEPPMWEIPRIDAYYDDGWPD